MRNYTTKKPFALILIVLILSNGISVFAQAKRAGVKPKTATPSVAAAETLVSENGSAAMNAAWQSGKLPAPLPVPSQNADEAAAILAQKVAAKSNESIPALLTALQMSGFFVTDQSGKTLYSPADGKGQGLTINGWEAASVAKMYGDGKQTNLAELGEKLRSIPILKEADVADYLLGGVRRNAENGRDKHLRVWARFIVELGKNSAAKYDLLKGSAGAEQVSLDAIQHLLLMRRLYGDLFAVSERHKPQSPTMMGAVFQPASQPQFIDAKFSANEIFAPARPGFENFSQVARRADDAAAQKQIPCRMDGLAPTVMDGAATIMGVGFGELTGYLEDYFEDTPAGEKIKNFGKIIAAMNIILAYAKFIQTYASLEAKIVMEDAPPLVRTKNAAAGERKKFRTEVRVNIGNWQMYNCIRTAMNITTGLDFATLNDGPLGDVGIRWHLDEGGANGGGEQIVGFTQEGATRIQDKGTSAGTGTNAVRDLTYTKTDDQGIARIILEGTPQRNFKGANAVPVTKQAKIRTTIKMKAGEIKGDMVDVAGQAIANIPGLITMPTELLYRMDWASVASLTVPVRDWEICEGRGWNGTIEVSYRKSENWTKVTNKGEHLSDQHYSGTEQYKWIYTYDAIFNVQDSPGEMNEDGSITAELNGSITAEALRLSETKDSWTTKTDCFPDPPRVAGRNSMSIIKESGKINETGDRGTLRITGDKFKIAFLISEIGGKYEKRESMKDFGWCMMDMNPPHESTSESSMSFSMEGIVIEGTIDPKTPTVLQGSQSYTDEAGMEVVLRWSLRKCS